MEYAITTEGFAKEYWMYICAIVFTQSLNEGMYVVFLLVNSKENRAMGMASDNSNRGGNFIAIKFW